MTFHHSPKVITPSSRCHEVLPLARPRRFPNISSAWPRCTRTPRQRLFPACQRKLGGFTFPVHGFWCTLYWVFRVYRVGTSSLANHGLHISRSIDSKNQALRIRSERLDASLPHLYRLTRSSLFSGHPARGPMTTVPKRDDAPELTSVIEALRNAYALLKYSRLASISDPRPSTARISSSRTRCRKAWRSATPPPRSPLGRRSPSGAWHRKTPFISRQSRRRRIGST